MKAMPAICGGNPVRKKFAAVPEEWQWSSAYARKTGTGVIPDIFNMPVSQPDPQKQRHARHLCDGHCQGPAEP